MSHVIAEEQKHKPDGTYFLNISYSGGVTQAEITFCANEGASGTRWRTVLREQGRDAEDNARCYWRSL